MGCSQSKKSFLRNLGRRSYVPSGLTKSQYEAIRKKDDTKKEKNYQKNVAKAGKFLDYTDYYTKRGTDKNEGWYNAPGRGHSFAKPKYDYSGSKGDEPGYGGVNIGIKK